MWDNSVLSESENFAIDTNYFSQYIKAPYEYYRPFIALSLGITEQLLKPYPF